MLYSPDWTIIRSLIRAIVYSADRVIIRTLDQDKIYSPEYGPLSRLWPIVQTIVNIKAAVQTIV